MKVKQLIKELLEMPMDAEVLVSEQMEDGDWFTKHESTVVDYEDGSIGILGCGERVS